MLLTGGYVSAETTDDQSNNELAIQNILGQGHQIFMQGQNQAEQDKNDPYNYSNFKKSKDNQFSPDENVRVIIEVDQPTDSINPSTTKDKKEKYDQIQDRVITKLPKEQSKDKKSLSEPTVRHRFYEGFNGFSVETQYKNLEEIQKIEGVKSVHIARTFQKAADESKGLVQAQKVWESLGYQGEGMLIGVVDSGIDYKHQDMTLTDKGKQMEKLTPNNIQDKLAQTPQNDVWYSDKVPTGYDWADNDNDVYPKSDPHGMHVSGIIGANGNEAGDGVKGITPGAQLLAEKVFSDKGGGAKEDDIIAGIQHSIQMGADVINMSLGSDAGPVSEVDDPVQKTIREATEKGILVVVAGGNAAYSTKNHLLPSSLEPYAQNPDVGDVGSPGVSPFALQVASYENNSIQMKTLHLSTGTELPYQDQTYSGFVLANKLDPSKEYEVVYGVEGKDTDIKNIDCTGKIVIVRPKTTYSSYSYAQFSAQRKGAVATILVPPPQMADYPQLYFSPLSIPAITVSKDAGQGLIDQLQNGQKITMKLSNGTWIDNTLKNQMSNFSSMGTPTTLDFKPEISGVGGNIYSTIPNNKYQVMSGTSMATPQVAGGAALVLQSLYSKGLPKTEDTVLKAKIALMNTSSIVSDPRANNSVPYSPRVQGAGLMQVANAINTPVLVTNKRAPLEQAGSVALKEIKENNFNFKLEMEALDGKDVPDNMEYKVVVDVLTDETEHKEYDLNADGSNHRSEDYLTMKSTRIEGADVHVNGGQTIQISKGKKKELSIDIKLPKNMKKNTFVEGFVRFIPTANNKSDKVVPLSMPYMGFYGNWVEPQNLDPAAWDKDAFLGYTALWDDIADLPLGYNAQTNSFNVDQIAVSPLSGAHGAYASFTALRNLSKAEMYIEDKDGNIVNYLGDFSEFTGSPYKFHKNIMSVGNYYYNIDLDNYYWKGKDQNGQVVKDGDYNYVIRTTLDSNNAAPQTVKLPIKLDSVAPTVSDIQVQPTTDGKYQITFNANDNQGGCGYYESVVYVDGQYTLLKPGATSLTVKKEPKSIVVMAEDHAYNEGFTVWGDTSYINPSILVSYFQVQNNKNVNAINPAHIYGFASNKLNWKIYIKDSNGNTVFTKTIETTDQVRLDWAPSDDIPNGTYTVYADAENVQGFKVTATASNKVTVVH
jgi:lactocepin